MQALKMMMDFFCLKIIIALGSYFDFISVSQQQNAYNQHIFSLQINLMIKKMVWLNGGRVKYLQM